jgi:hypothetical protein
LYPARKEFERRGMEKKASQKANELLKEKCETTRFSSRLKALKCLRDWIGSLSISAAAA